MRPASIAWLYPGMPVTVPSFSLNSMTFAASWMYDAAERVEVEILFPELAVDRHERFADAHHRHDVLHQAAMHRDRHGGMERDALDLGPDGIALGHVAPYVNRELAQPRIADVFDRGEGTEDICFLQHPVDIRWRADSLLVDDGRTGVLTSSHAHSPQSASVQRRLLRSTSSG